MGEVNDLYKITGGGVRLVYQSEAPGILQRCKEMCTFDPDVMAENGWTDDVKPF